MSWLDEAKAKRQNALQSYVDERTQKEQFCDSISPMVERLLTDIGDAYWGLGQHEVIRAGVNWTVEHRINAKVSYIFLVAVKFPGEISLYFPNPRKEPFFRVYGQGKAIETSRISEELLKKVLVDIYSAGPFIFDEDKQEDV
jgi:hypothetical protein